MLNPQWKKSAGKRMAYCTLLCLALPAYAQEAENASWWQVWKKIPGLSPQIEEPVAQHLERTPGSNTETMILGEPRTQWLQDATLFVTPGDETEVKNIIEPLQWRAVDDEIGPEAAAALRAALAERGEVYSARLHIIGHTDAGELLPQELAQYQDKTEFTRARAQLVAEYFQLALELPAEAVTFEGAGDAEPLEENITALGREQNRRVEVHLHYEELDEEALRARARAEALKLNRIKVCRAETVCRLTYQTGSEQRARLKNLVTPLRMEPGQVDLPQAFVRRIAEVRANLAGKQNLTVHFIGHTDGLPLPEGPADLYADHLQLSAAEARRIALAVRDSLGLPGYAVTSAGRGSSQPLAGNDTAQGRALNRRVEVEFWYDDVLQTSSDQVQLCPEDAGAETITVNYLPAGGGLEPIRFEGGVPQISEAYAARLNSALAEIAGKTNARIGFVGYSANERMERREAMVYGDDLGLSASRARRAMEQAQQMLGLSGEQVEFTGRGYVQARDLVADGFVTDGEARVEVQLLYDELAVLAENDRLEIERIEREALAHNPYALNLMRISVDGEPEYDPHKSSMDLQRCTDLALENARIQFRFDNKTMAPRLNVTAWPSTIRYAPYPERDPETELAENRVEFQSYTNYAGFVQRAEVRLFEEEQSTRDLPLAVVELDADGRGYWEADFEEFRAPLKKVQYLLRVYDEHGRFDETRPQNLWLVDEVEPQAPDLNPERELLVGYGESRLGSQRIPLDGNTVLVNGERIPPDHSVWVAGRRVPVNGEGQFVAEEIFTKGLHTVEVAVLDPQGNGELFLRDLRFESEGWFYVGIADLTIARDKTTGPAALVTQDETHYDNSVSYDGRLAFYASGGFGDGWRLSASADTEEGPVNELFSNFMDKSPDALFRRLDSDLHYPSFGDDSTLVEDAPTSGKFYVKLNKYENYGLWGNFKASYTDNELAHIDRALYGGTVHFEGKSLTSFGEEKFAVDAFAAEPGTVAGRDEFRATGGSLYFLRHQDILGGSDRLRVEVRDKDSGIVLGVKNLTPVIDYDIDYLQGRVLLSRPLSSFADDNQIIQDGAAMGHHQYLVARYEYTPGFQELDTLALGGRAHYWAGDHVKIGLSASQQNEEDNESSLHGVDVTLRKSAGTWLKVEAAQSRGNTLDSFNSLDGGFSFGGQEQLFDPDATASAQRIEASLQLNDFFEGSRGSGTLYHRQRDAGFAAPGQLVTRDTTQYGASISVPIGRSFDVGLKADSNEQTQGLQTSAVDAELGYQVSERWRLATAARMDSREDHSPVVPVTQTEGDRTDVALKAGYDSGSNWNAYGFVQRTAKVTGTRDENSRAGLGGGYRVSERLALDSEVSGGDTGTAARLGTDYLITDRTSLYLNYSLDNERTDTGLRARKGNMNTGFRSRFTDTVNIYGEERYAHGDVATGLTHALGVDLAPNDRWSYGTSLEAGTLRDPFTNAKTERRVVGGNMGYHNADIKYSTGVEYRVDNTETLPDPETVIEAERKTWLLKNTLSYQISPDWRLVGKLNYSDSKSSQGQFYDGKFTEAVMGYAYRPVYNDRWNTLIKYTYFYNVPTADQVTVQNTRVEFIQKSHIFAVDTTYDLSQRWSIGGKYAYRLGQLSMERENPEFFDSRASLYVLRADWHFVHRWDLLIEGRLLDLPDAADRRSGFLVGLYRHMGNHFKAGVGYNFTDFSDDLTQLDYNSQGVFINMIGKL